MKEVPSDIGVDQLYLPSEEFATQSCLDEISHWTQDNLMKLNEKKCNYMIFSRSETDFSTRLHINGHLLERVPSVKLLGMQISEDLFPWFKIHDAACFRQSNAIQSTRSPY